MADWPYPWQDLFSIPIYPTLTSEGINQILTHSEPKAIIIGKTDDLHPKKQAFPISP